MRIKISKRDSTESLSILKKKLIETAQEICLKSKSSSCNKCPDKFFCQSLLSFADFLLNYITERLCENG